MASKAAQRSPPFLEHEEEDLLDRRNHRNISMRNSSDGGSQRTPSPQQDTPGHFAESSFANEHEQHDHGPLPPRRTQPQRDAKPWSPNPYAELRQKLQAHRNEMDKMEKELLKEKEEFEERLRKRELAHSALIQKLMHRSVEKRHFARLPPLTSATGLENWDWQLRAALAPYDLFRYLADDVPPPQPRSDDKFDNLFFEEELKQWKTDRADIFRLITASLRQGPIWLRMRRLGWVPEDVDPRQTYLKVYEALRPGRVPTTPLAQRYDALKWKALTGQGREETTGGKQKR